MYADDDGWGVNCFSEPSLAVRFLEMEDDLPSQHHGFALDIPRQFLMQKIIISSAPFEMQQNSETFRGIDTIIVTGLGVGNLVKLGRFLWIDSRWTEAQKYFGDLHQITFINKCCPLSHFQFVSKFLEFSGPDLPPLLFCIVQILFVF